MPGQAWGLRPLGWRSQPASDSGCRSGETGFEEGVRQAATGSGMHPGQNAGECACARGDGARCSNPVYARLLRREPTAVKKHLFKMKAIPGATCLVSHYRHLKEWAICAQNFCTDCPVQTPALSRCKASRLTAFGTVSTSAHCVLDQNTVMQRRFLLTVAA